MRTVGTIIFSVLTTVVTMFALLFWTELEILENVADIVGFTIQEEGSIPVMANWGIDETHTVAVLNHEEAQMDAIETVAEAIVGIVSVTDYREGVFGLGLQQSGTGSGIVYAVREGHTYIVTNEHVIDKATHIEVVFNNENQTRLPAQLVGKDVYTDIAVLRIEDFEAEIVAEFGNTEQLRLGQTVIAIGNPLGLEFAGSATMGVVSGHDRHIPIPILSTNGYAQNWIMTVLQTDAAINPGNSGGALINLSGEVVGINSMKITQSAVEGMSFSIPTYIALPIIESLENYGIVTRPLLEISIVNLSTVPILIREDLNLPADITTGVFVSEVKENGLATTLGLEVGDVITHIGSIEIPDHAAFRQALSTYRDKDDLTVTLIRDGISTERTITLDLT